MTTLRPCPQCAQPYAGRADKRFCSTACRAQHFRDAQTALAQEELADEDEGLADDVEEGEPMVAAVPLASQATPPGPARAQLDAWDRLALKEFIAETVSHKLQKQATQAAEQALHARYVRWAQTWLQPAGTPLSVRLVGQLVRETEQLSTDYQTHPAITQPKHPARLRLQLLYKLGDELRALQQELQAEAKSFFGAARPTATLEVGKKRRGQLRESLLGEA